MTKISKERLSELKDLVENKLAYAIYDVMNEYGWWDGDIEDGRLTVEEFELMSAVFDVRVSVKIEADVDTTDESS